MSHNVSLFYQAVLHLTRQGGKLVKDRIWGQKTIQIKSSEIDLVTETDQEVEKLLINGLKTQFPGHRFIGEETTAEGVKPELTDEPTWIIDPVDGTLNFVHGYPCVCISIALLINKVPEIGIIYNPILDQLFSATKGGGAFLNNEKILVSKTKGVVAVSFGHSDADELHVYELQNPISMEFVLNAALAYNNPIPISPKKYDFMKLVKKYVPSVHFLFYDCLIRGNQEKDHEHSGDEEK